MIVVILEKLFLRGIIMENKDSIFFPKEGVFSPSHIKRSKGEKVCGIDLDDVLADSTPAWINYANKTMKTELLEAHPDLDSMRWLWETYIDLYDLKQHVPYYYYRLLKEMYRVSDVKKELNVIKNAPTLLRLLGKEEYKRVIITGRSESSSKITIDWLVSKGLEFDEIIFDKDKHVKILLRFPDLSFMVEDNRDIANIVGKWGYCVFLLTNRYNFGSVGNVIRVNNLMEIIRSLEEC